VVSIPPLEGLVEPLVEAAGGSVRVLAPSGGSAHGFELTPEGLRAIIESDVLVTIGLGLDPQVGSAASAHPSFWRKDVVLGDVLGFASNEPGRSEEGDDHTGHDHGAIDPHIWLDPALVSRSISAMAGAISDVSPGSSELVLLAAQSQLDRVQAIDVAYQVALAPYKGRKVVTLHSAWGRLFERHGIEQVAVIRPIESVEPTPSEIAAVITLVREHNIGVIFVEPQHSRSAADRIADATGARIYTIDPIGSGDWEKMMQRNLNVLVEAFSE